MSTPVDRNRRALLRGRLSPPRLVVRPPWSLAEQVFLEFCTRCGNCAEACPERIVVLDERGYPELDFKNGGCAFCGACVEACDEPVFDRHRDTPPWEHVVAVNEDCLADRGIFCMSCRDACVADALVFARGNARLPVPAPDASRCTGCGECLSTCPADAIQLVRGTPAQTRRS